MNAMQAAAGAGSASAGSSVEVQQREAMVAEAAYRRYEARGRAPGGELEDWLAAEQEVDRALGGEGAAAESSRSAFLKSLGALLAETQAQLEELATKARAANAALLRSYEEQRALAAVKCEAARARFAEVREHTGGAWGHLRDGAEKAALEMRIAVQELAALFKSPA